MMRNGDTLVLAAVEDEGIIAVCDGEGEAARIICQYLMRNDDDSIREVEDTMFEGMEINEYECDFRRLFGDQLMDDGTVFIASSTNILKDGYDRVNVCGSYDDAVEIISEAFDMTKDEIEEAERREYDSSVKIIPVVVNEFDEHIGLDL